MNEKDIVTRNFFEDNERFADIVNVAKFHGKPIVEGKNLQSVEGFSGAAVGKGRKKAAVHRQRDIIKKSSFGTNYILIGIENQSDIHYAMPVRVMGYDFLGYDRQVKEIRKAHRKKKDLSGKEYLSGLAKGDRLKPVLTLVLYYGEEEWDGPKSLHDMLDFKEIPEELRQDFADYPITVVDMRRFAESEKLRTSARIVFGFLKRQNDKEELKKYIERNREVFYDIEEEAYDMIAVLADAPELIDRKSEYTKERGKVDMCEALKQLKAEGKIEGKSEILLEMLKELGEVPEGISEKICAEKEDAVLIRWIKVIAKAGSVEEFIRQM